MSLWLALLAGAYLLGSVSPSYLIVRWLTRRDVRAEGSGNAGATNVLRVAGRGPAIAALLADVAKGIAAVAVARLLAAPPPVVAGAAVAVVAGHVFPIFLGFRGGKGVATSAGAVGAMAPLAMVFAVLVFVLVVAWKRYVSLGSITAAALLPFAVGVEGLLGLAGRPEPWAVGGAAVVAGLVIARHAANLRRLRAGSEPHLGERPGGAGA